MVTKTVAVVTEKPWPLTKLRLIDRQALQWGLRWDMAASVLLSGLPEGQEKGHFSCVSVGTALSSTHGVW